MGVFSTKMKWSDPRGWTGFSSTSTTMLSMQTAVLNLGKKEKREKSINPQAEQHSGC